MSLILTFGFVVLMAIGCSKKADVKALTTELEKAFPEAAIAPGNQPTANASGYVKAAVAAARTNDYAAGVVVLQQVMQTPGVTPQQLMVVQQTKEAMMSDLVDRAANGDPSAKAALAAIERTRSQ